MWTRSIGASLLIATALVTVGCAAPAGPTGEADGANGPEGPTGQSEAPAGEPDDAAGATDASQAECFDADYPIEPTFETPEEALAHALEAGTAEVDLPDDPGAYERVDRADDVVEFEFGDDAAGHTWGVIRDDDGQWGVASLGGCHPVGG